MQRHSTRMGSIGLFLMIMCNVAYVETAKNPLNDAVSEIVVAWRAGTPPPELWRQLHGLNSIFMTQIKAQGLDWADSAAEGEMTDKQALSTCPPVLRSSYCFLH